MKSPIKRWLYVSRILVAIHELGKIKVDDAFCTRCYGRC